MSTLQHGAFDIVNHNNITPAKEVGRMKMNCFQNVPARLVLYFLSWSGFLVSFMMRNDINFALVVMVKTVNSTKEEETVTLNGNTSSNVTDSPTYVI